MTCNSLLHASLAKSRSRGPDNEIQGQTHAVDGKKEQDVRSDAQTKMCTFTHDAVQTVRTKAGVGMGAGDGMGICPDQAIGTSVPEV